jgi:hypothetical protein
VNNFLQIGTFRKEQNLMTYHFSLLPSSTHFHNIKCIFKLIASLIIIVHNFFLLFIVMHHKIDDILYSVEYEISF